MVTAWDYSPGRIGGNRTGKMTSLMQPMRGMDWEAYKLMQPTRVQGIASPMRFKNSDLRSKCTTGTSYIGIHVATTTKTHIRTVDKCWVHLAALWTLGTWTLRLDYGLVD